MTRTYAKLESALKVAKTLAEDGPRVAAVLHSQREKKYAAVPGYMDGDTKKFKQVALVTPDGRVWEPRQKEETTHE